MSRRQVTELVPKTLEELRDGPGSTREVLEKEFGAFGVIVMPGDAEAPILTPPVRAALHQWLFEMNAEAELKAVGLKSRSRCLLSGPPGCGKTTLAHHITARLGVPMVVIQSSAMVSSALGGTGGNIRKLFRSARRGGHDVALFFDEFDAMARSREKLGDQACDNEKRKLNPIFVEALMRWPTGLSGFARAGTGLILWQQHMGSYVSMLFSTIPQHRQQEMF